MADSNLQNGLYAYDDGTAEDSSLNNARALITAMRSHA
jgi:hypothetical protein